MKKWGLFVTAYYVITIAAMLWPLFFNVVAVLFSKKQFTWHDYSGGLGDLYGTVWFALPVAVVFLGQIVLFCKIDRSARRLKPETSVFWPAALSCLFTAVLGFCLFNSVGVAWRGDKFPDYFDQHSKAGVGVYLGFWPLLWVVWGIVFYIRSRNTESPLSRATSWLLKGSILEFLIVVPCHVIVRRRDDCCAPYVTSLGLCTGLAIMLISFGPSVLLLYKKQMEWYKTHGSQND